MAIQMTKKVIDFIYGASKVKRRFQAAHPGETVLASDACKGFVSNRDKAVKQGADWVTAQRATLLLTDKRIVCGKWEIPLDIIVEAHLITFSSLFSSGQVLKIGTAEGDFYQFGMEKNPEWTRQATLPLTLEKGPSIHPLVKTLFWVILLGYLIYSFFLN